MATASRKKRSDENVVFAPEMRVTKYDRVSSGLTALVFGLIVAVLALGGAWLMNRPAREDEPVPVELIEFPGGVDDGAIDETLLVESPEDPIPDASQEEVQEEMQTEEIFETVTELADVSADQLLRQYETDVQSSGKVGSREGTGRRALGDEGGESGIPREQRWYIQFANQRDIDEYGRQLDYFGIELGTILPDGTLVYLSDLGQPTPTVRRTTSGRGENRMYMTWQGGQLKSADQTFFKRASIPVTGGRVLHFYPPETESKLAQLERDYANRRPDEIRRTYFAVDRVRGGYEFRVNRQSYFR